MRIKNKLLSLFVPIRHAKWQFCRGYCLGVVFVLLVALLALSAPGLAWAKKQTQEDALPTDAEAKANAVCAKTDVFNCYSNNKYGYLIAWPHKLLTGQGESDAGDGQVFSSAAGLAQLTCWAGYNNVLQQSFKKEFAAAQHEPGLEVTYKHMGKNSFVVSGNKDGMVLYRKTVMTPQVRATFVLIYAQTQKNEFDQLVGDIANSFIIYGR